MTRPQPTASDRCPMCGPGYWYGDDGCHHKQPTASAGDVDQLALRLMTAWEAAEGPVSASYVATFADMARAVLASDWLADVRREERERVLGEVERTIQDYADRRAQTAFNPWFNPLAGARAEGRVGGLDKAAEIVRDARGGAPCPRPEPGLCGTPDPKTNVPCWLTEDHADRHGWEQ